MVTNRVIQIGTRVMIKGDPSGVRLRSNRGEIVRFAELDGYVIVRLDEPAISYDEPDSGTELSEIMEAVDNLDVDVHSR